MLRGRTASAAPSALPVATGVELLAGAASTVAHSGGVVLGLYLVGWPLSSAGVVATGTLAYAMSDVVKVGTYAAIGWITLPLLLATVVATRSSTSGAGSDTGSTRGCRGGRSR
jgi:hypothetical protein